LTHNSPDGFRKSRIFDNIISRNEMISEFHVFQRAEPAAKEESSTMGNLYGIAETINPLDLVVKIGYYLA
jgi:hypothetical protein